MQTFSEGRAQVRWEGGWSGEGQAQVVQL